MSPCFEHLVSIPSILHPQVDHQNISLTVGSNQSRNFPYIPGAYISTRLYTSATIKLGVITQERTINKLKTTKIRIWNLQSTTPPFPGPKNLTNRCSGFDIWVTSYVQFPSPAFKDPKWFARFCPWSKLHMEAAAPASLVIWKKEIP